MFELIDTLLRDADPARSQATGLPAEVCDRIVATPIEPSGQSQSRWRTMVPTVTKVVGRRPQGRLVTAAGIAAAVGVAVVLAGTPGGAPTPDARAAVSQAISQLPGKLSSGELRIDYRTIRNSDQSVLAANSDISRYNGNDTESVSTDTLRSVTTGEMRVVKGAVYRRLPGESWTHLLPPAPFNEKETAKRGPGLSLGLASPTSLAAIAAALGDLARTSSTDDTSIYSGTTTAEALEVAKEEANTDIPVPLTDVDHPELSSPITVQIVVNRATNTIRSLTFTRANREETQTSTVTFDFRNLDTPQTVTAPNAARSVAPPALPHHLKPPPEAEPSRSRPAN